MPDSAVVTDHRAHGRQTVLPVRYGHYQFWRQSSPRLYLYQGDAQCRGASPRQYRKGCSRNAREGHLPASRPDCPARDARPARCFVNHDDAVILKQDIQRDVFGLDRTVF